MSVKYITCKCDKRSVTSEDTSYAHTIMSEERKTIRKRRETEAKREREASLKFFRFLAASNDRRERNERQSSASPRVPLLLLLLLLLFLYFPYASGERHRRRHRRLASAIVGRERERKWKMGRETFLYAIVDVVHRTDRVLLYK